MDRNHLNNFERGATKDHSCEVWSKSNHWFRRRCCLKIVDGRTDRRTSTTTTTDGEWSQYLTLSLRLRWAKKGQSKSCPSCMGHSYLTWYMSLPYFIKLSQIVWELWPAQDFFFRGDNYIKKKVRVVSLAHDLPTAPPLYSYQILSNYLKQYGSYGLHKISASGEKST